MSKEWFEWYVKEASKSKRWPMYKGRFLCPCCFMPTLRQRAAYSICPICYWEDDGQDTDDQYTVRGGPNGSYSLKEARDNFAKCKTMYRESDKRTFDYQSETKLKRMKLYEAFTKAIDTNTDEDWNRALKLRNIKHN